MKRLSETPDLVFALHFEGEHGGDQYRVTAGTLSGWQWRNARLGERGAYRVAGAVSALEPLVLVEQRNAYVRAIKPATVAGLRVRIE